MGSIIESVHHWATGRTRRSRAHTESGTMPGKSVFKHKIHYNDHHCYPLQLFSISHDYFWNKMRKQSVLCDSCDILEKFNPKFLFIISFTLGTNSLEFSFQMQKWIICVKDKQKMYKGRYLVFMGDSWILWWQPEPVLNIINPKVQGTVMGYIRKYNEFSFRKSFLYTVNIT